MLEDPMNCEDHITLTWRWRRRTFMQDVGRSLAVGMVSISEEFSLQLHGSESHKCH